MDPNAKQSTNKDEV